ncbi:MAG TPA: hypothetical protein VGM54_09850 [Chthoniobacter sp.]|jgi:hypothetical protein
MNAGLTAHDSETIKQIQERVGVEQTGEMDSKTVMAIHETLGLLQKFLTRKFSRNSRRKVTSG